MTSKGTMAKLTVQSSNLLSAAGANMYLFLHFCACPTLSTDVKIDALGLFWMADDFVLVPDFLITPGKQTRPDGNAPCCGSTKTKSPFSGIIATICLSVSCFLCSEMDSVSSETSLLFVNEIWKQLGRTRAQFIGKSRLFNEIKNEPEAGVSVRSFFMMTKLLAFGKEKEQLKYVRRNKSNKAAMLIDASLSVIRTAELTGLCIELVLLLRPTQQVICLAKISDDFTRNLTCQVHSGWSSRGLRLSSCRRSSCHVDLLACLHFWPRTAQNNVELYLSPQGCFQKPIIFFGLKATGEVTQFQSKLQCPSRTHHGSDGCSEWRLSSMVASSLEIPEIKNNSLIWSSLRVTPENIRVFWPLGRDVWWSRPALYMCIWKVWLELQEQHSTRQRPISQWNSRKKSGNNSSFCYLWSSFCTGQFLISLRS